jgi:hypothetical protein
MDALTANERSIETTQSFFVHVCISPNENTRLYGNTRVYTFPAFRDYPELVPINNVLFFYTHQIDM